METVRKLSLFFVAVMRWVQLRRDHAEIKEELRTNKALLTAQNELLQEILENAKVRNNIISSRFPHTNCDIFALSYL